MAEVPKGNPYQDINTVIAMLSEIAPHLHALLLDDDRSKAMRLMSEAKNIGRIASDTEPSLRAKFESQ